jgi:uncharacterized protein YkwD
VPPQPTPPPHRRAAPPRPAKARGRTCSCRLVKAGRRHVKRCTTRSAKRKAGATTKKSAPATRPASSTTAPSAGGPGPNPPAPIGPCANADLLPGQGTVDQLRDATVCLVNQERAKAGLGALGTVSSMQTAADRYSLRMVVERFFDHVAPDGSDLLGRLMGVGYVQSGSAYKLGENIGYGTGSLGTPAAMVRAWMASPGHRANILTPDFRNSGVGVAIGIPAPASNTPAGATYTQDFGTL